MTKLSIKRQLSLGLFVSIAVIMAIGLVYYMGTRKQWFGDNIKAYTYFYNVSGLQPGNVIRFSGINVGTVENIRLVSDSSVRADLILSKEAAGFIKVDSKAMIESDGLMGNKVISITAGSVNAPSISENDTLQSKSPVSLDQVINSFKSTSDNANQLTNNLKIISDRILQSKGLLGKLVADSLLAERISNTVESFEQTSQNTKQITAEVLKVSEAFNDENGLMYKLLKDSVMSNTLLSTVDSLSVASDRLSSTSKELESFAGRLNNKNGAVNLLLTDSLFARDLEATLKNIRDGTSNLDDVVNTVNESWLLNLFSQNEKEKNTDKKDK